MILLPSFRKNFFEGDVFPGVWIGRLFNTSLTNFFQGYIVLENLKWKKYENSKQVIFRSELFKHTSIFFLIKVLEFFIDNPISMSLINFSTYFVLTFTLVNIVLYLLDWIFWVCFHSHSSLMQNPIFYNEEKEWNSNNSGLFIYEDDIFDVW